MNHHQMKIKINGQEKAYGQGKKKRKQQSKKEKVPPIPDKVKEDADFPEGDLPIIIVDESAAAAEKKEAEEFEWVLPKEPNPSKKQQSSYIEDLRKTKGSKSSPSPFGKKKQMVTPSFAKQLLLSIGMAIGIGTCLGFIILAIMNISDSPTNPNVPAVAPVDSENGPDADSSQASGNESITLKAQTLSVLQAGVFSKSDSVNEEIDRLKAAGFPAVAIGSDPTHIFMAVGKSVEGMKEIGSEVNGKGIEPSPFAKEIAVPEKTLNSLTTPDLTLLEEGQQFYLQLTEATSLLLQGSTLDGATKETIQSSFEKVAAIKDQELTEITTEWKASLLAAFESYQSYQKSSNEQDLWSAQQKLLDALKIYY
ncbi:hypothetical protein [Sutcliffiella rhizosphaerae]|uniref:SPOR domain-containing protein n=1 Tax=Sutcliffiella rhizosphaerae TaxID=2880967 RepID=A0ABM8YI57_9BACI|nr:hypothetical protein [Sutcliffiella rhizosphaerae]CAG9619504.1 hypothetical protein BACCIP111883_00271 [Sutcliffiella rhizosphaerae]